MNLPGGVSAAWEENAQDWINWTRTPDHDAFFWHFQHPAFARIVPQPGRRTMEIGCGEGRVGRALAADGHRVAGIDSSSTLAESAREAGGYDEIVCGDAASLPWPEDAFDAAVAFMVLQDMPSMPEAVREVARVLEVGSPFCIAIVHPLNRPHEQLTEYFTEHRISDVVEKNGLHMNFVGINRPFETYTQALCDAGFVIEQLREPRPDPASIERVPELAVAAHAPFFVHLGARLTRKR